MAKTKNNPAPVLKKYQRYINGTKVVVEAESLDEADKLFAEIEQNTDNNQE